LELLFDGRVLRDELVLRLVFRFRLLGKSVLHVDYKMMVTAKQLGSLQD
jgi:hypothetical protein